MFLALVTVMAASPASQTLPLPARDQHYAVRTVVDGDTLEVATVGRVRLLGIDAPERGAGLDTPAPFAREARNHLLALAGRRYIRLETDIETRDSYQRLLAYVVRDDGVFVNAEMLRAGLARITARVALRRLDELRRAEDEARRARRGIWGHAPWIATGPQEPAAGRAGF